VSTESSLNVKKFEQVGEFKNKIEKIQKPFYLAYVYMCLKSAKNENKKSHESVPLTAKKIIISVAP
jgi:hypothetical protein